MVNKMGLPGSRLRLHFELTLENGEVIDSNFSGEAVSLTLGDGNLPESFERLIVSMKPGQHQTFTVLPEQAFGAHNPANLQEINRDQFVHNLGPHTKLEPGLVISFADASRGELPGVVSEVNGDVVIVDFNHPLAGRTLGFRVHLLSVESEE